MSLIILEVVTLNIYFVARLHPFTWLHTSSVHSGVHFPPHLGPNVPGGHIWLQTLPKYPGGHTLKRLK